MDKREKIRRDKKRQHHKQKTDDLVQSTDHRRQSDHGERIEIVQPITREEEIVYIDSSQDMVSIESSYANETTIEVADIPDAENIFSSTLVRDNNTQQVQTELTIDPKMTVSIIIAKNEDLCTENSVASTKDQLNLKLTPTSSGTCGKMQVISIDVSDSTQQNKASTSQISIIQPRDDSIKDLPPMKKIDHVKTCIKNIVRTIDELVQNSDKGIKISGPENFDDKNQSEDIIKFDLISTPSTSYHEISNFKTSRNNIENVPLVPYSVFIPDTMPDEILSKDPYYFEAIQEDTTPINKDVSIKGKKIKFSPENQKEKALDDTSQLTLSKLIAFFHEVSNLEVPTSSANLDAVDSQNIPVKNNLNLTKDTIPDEDQDITYTSQSTPHDEIQDENTTGSSMYQSALYDPNNTSLFETASSENLNTELQDSSCNSNLTKAFKCSKVTIDEKDKHECTQAELKITDQDTSQLDDSDSIALLYDPNLTFPFKGAEEAPPMKPLLFAIPEKKKQDRGLPKREKEIICIPKTILNKKEGKSDDNKTEVLMSKTLIDKSMKNKSFLNITAQNESLMDQNLFMQFPNDWSTLSDFNIESAKDRNIVHSTPVRQMTITKIIEEKTSSMNFEPLKNKNITSSVNLQQAERIKKQLSVAKSSSSSMEEVSIEEAVNTMNETGSQVDWFWLPANKLDLFLPLDCSYQILIGEDTHSDSSSRVDENGKEAQHSDTESLTAFQTSTKEDVCLARGDALTEHNKTFDRPRNVLNKTFERTENEPKKAFDRPRHSLNETFIREGPELKKNLNEHESELNKTFDRPFSDPKKRFSLPIPIISPEHSAPAKKETFVKLEPVEIKPLKEYKNKGWAINEEHSSFFTLNLIIHGFYDLYDIPKYSPRSVKLSTIYEVSESDSATSISQLRVDAAQQAKIREFAEYLTRARRGDHFYYDMGSVTSCITENPFTSIDEFFVLGKYKLFLDEESDDAETTLISDVDDLAQHSRLKIADKNPQEGEHLVDQPKCLSTSTSNWQIIKEDILVDADLESFCKQELDKFPKDNLGIRFKQIIKYNGKILFDCRCNYDELPLKLRRKYEGQEHMLLEFNHLIIPKQRQVYFSLHCCRHTIEEMLHIICITGKNKYIDPTCVEELVCSYRCAYIKSQLTHTPETLPYPDIEPKFFGNVIDENAKNKFVQDWLNNSKAASQTKLEQPLTTGSGITGHYSENEDEPFVNLLELEESVNRSTLRFSTRPHTKYDKKKDYPENS